MRAEKDRCRERNGGDGSLMMERMEEHMIAEKKEGQDLRGCGLAAEPEAGGLRNEMELEFDAISNNESFARVAVAAFVSSLNPTVEELADIKTAVSEAVTNAIIHGYENIGGYGRHGESRPFFIEIHPGKVRVRCLVEQDWLHIEVEDQGKGIENLEQAMEPLFTTKPELERSGMGFAFMEAFMDDLEVESAPGVGTKVRMKKKLGTGAWILSED